MILCLETATSVCSVALCDTSGILSSRESHEDKSHATLLTPFIEDILKENRIEAADLSAVAVSKGPGSYTGLRIGVSVAKGLAYGASVPLIGIETTRSMFYGLMKKHESDPAVTGSDLICPMLDAKRMEAYYCIFDRNGSIVKDIAAEIIDQKSFIDMLKSNRIVFFGDGASKFRKVISHENAIFIDDFTLSAAYMHCSAYEAFNKGAFENVAYFEPFYLKDFVATIPRKNIIR
jgi:tRNA threonylcarbamoyladenosine biosynthesis protein TsaB